jgi:hypothetical protein
LDLMIEDLLIATSGISKKADCSICVEVRPMMLRGEMIDGRTIAEMQRASIFISIGWDFVNEGVN